ncbi:MAG TPA: hypothetical protein VJ979_10675 [Actinomycetota bacterium]|nr:hypothetical protein [Actinomycetota bacterium]
MTLALSTAFLAAGMTVLFTVPVSAGQVDGSLGRWLMFIGAVGGLALIATGLVLFARVRDAESRHREQISQVVAFQHELRWHMSEMASGAAAAAAADTNEDPAAVQARRVIADALDWFERELPEYFELLRRPTTRNDTGSAHDGLVRYSNSLDEILLALSLRGRDG